MTKRIYKCRCHVCGRKFDYESSFMSCSSYADGRARIACNVRPDLPQHKPEEIRRSWVKGDVEVPHGGTS